MPQLYKDNDQPKENKKDAVNDGMASISYFTLYRFASKWDKLLIAISIIASFISGATLPYAITLVANVFHIMITYNKSVQNHTQDSEGFLRNMHEFGVQYSCIGAVLFVGGYLGNALMSITAINQVYRIRREYLTAVLNQDFAYFDLHQTGDFASKMSDDLIKLEEGISDKVSAMVYSSTTAIGCVFMALLKGWKLALLCLTTTPVTFALVGFTGRHLSMSNQVADRLYQQQALQTGKASAIAQEVLGSIRTVYSFNGQGKELERYKEPLAEARRIYIKKEFFTGLSMGFLFFCVFSSYALSFYFGIYLVVNDPINYNADVMFSVFFGVMTAMGNFGIVGSLVRSFGLAKGAGAQIFHLLDNVPTINPLLDRGTKPHLVEGNIELKNVVFRYPSRPDVLVLKGLSLSVKRGQRVALVGHSGCGKSTIIQLISRYYDVISGSVCVDGYDVRDLSVRWLRSHIGVVGQEPVLFNTSVRENIRYGRDGGTDEDVVAVAKQANAHQFIMQLPKGYDTLVGERGASLSGGQKQRLAIARALIRDPRILLLDEATSALDTASEAKVQQALDLAAQGRTTIVVAHRLSTIRHADLIYVMKEGELVEFGTHDTLMASNGHYHDMVVLQEPQEVYGEDIIPLREDSKLSQEDIDDAIPAMASEDVKQEMKVPRLSFCRVLALKAPEWKWLTVGTICSVLIGFSMPLFILIFGDLFGSMSHPDPNKLMGKVNYVSMVCIAIGVVMGISNLIEALSFGVAGAHLTERLRSRMFGHMLKQHVAFYDDRANSTGALCAKLSAEPAYVQGATGQRIGNCLQGIGSIGLAVVLAMVFEWRVGLVALAFTPVVAVVVYQQSKATSEESFGNAKTLENSTKIALEAVSNIRTVVSIGRESLFVSEYVAELRPAIAPALRSAHCRAIVAGLSRSMFNFINSAALVYGGHLIVSEGVAYEDILVTTQSLQMASGQAQSAFAFVPDLQKGLDAASRIAALLSTAPKITDPSTPAVTPFVRIMFSGGRALCFVKHLDGVGTTALPLHGKKSKGEASLKDVDFTYPFRPGARVLNRLNMMVPNGKTVGLVGRSGCGKSTIIQLLQRFYDPDSGVVCLDEFPLGSLRVSEARYSLGLVGQEPVLFDCTIAENIAYGDNTRHVRRDELRRAAELANIHSFVVSLPQGYDTNIGSKGMQLSGGQKQRVAIARALIRHPKILLLDEATSALDTESEKAVQEASESARAGRTCITIAHRLSSVRGADVICVLSGGRVAEAGTHQELLNLQGIYYGLHRVSQ